MAEYIITVPDRHTPCAECERNPCVEIGCERAPAVYTSRQLERIVRCRDCAKNYQPWADGTTIPCPWSKSPDGFCAWGERREE